MKSAALGLFLLGNVFIQAAVAQTNDLSGRTLESIRSVVTLVANHQLRSLADGNYAPVYTLIAATNAAKPIGLQWDYPWGVNLYGLLRVGDVTGDTNVSRFVLDHDLIAGRYYSWLVNLENTCTNADGTPANPAGFYTTTALRDFFTLDIPGAGKLDYCGAMTAQLLEGALRPPGGPKPEQAQVIQNTSNYIAHVQGRLPDGTLYRPEANFTIWADDLYMSCPFLIRCVQYSGDTNLFEDAVRQVTNMAGYLQDTNGIWFHGYYVTSNKVNGIKWCRANGWAMVTTVEVLSLMPTNHPARSNLLEILRRHIAGIESVQQTSGMWRQILDYDDPGNWEETSSTAMFTYCIARAVNRGWIDPTNLVAAHNGFVAICRNIRTNGVVVGTCQGTGLDTRISFYLGRSRPDDDMHGRGPVLLAGAEVLSSGYPVSPALSLVKEGSHGILSWPAAFGGYTLETTTNLADWTVFPGSPANLGGQLVVTDNFSGLRFYSLRPPFGTNFEAELLSYPAYETNGATTSVIADLNASGGAWFSFNAIAVGNYIEFTLPRIPAGNYQLALRFRGATNRGQLSLQLDGSPVGGTLDQYRSSAAYVQTNFGSVLFPVAANHVVRLTVTGRNASASAYTLSADRFTLTPQ